MGFLGPVKEGPIAQLGVKLDARGNVAPTSATCPRSPASSRRATWRRGQSLVVWAIAEARQAARGIDLYLMGETN